MDGLGNNLLANGLLAAVYVLYKVVDRCLHSKCRYSKIDGFTFDMDGPAEECPATDMNRLAELLKSRAEVYQRKGTKREAPTV